jgi:hypothetical protein
MLGCWAQTYTPQPSPQTGRVVIYRYQDPVVGRKPSVHVDGIEVARLPRKKYFVLNLAPGRHIITGEKNENGIELSVERGRTYYVRGGMQTVSVWTRPHLMVFLVAPEQGEQDIKTLEALGTH